MKNEMTLAFDSISENEGFARVAVAAFVTQLNPTLDQCDHSRISGWSTYRSSSSPSE